ncbi:MAG: hypothetical protein Q4A84_10960, partial [Neisseria sp.]|uniref:hypothetical protein n=1 Tax=Neisseria sp. TaxID=192066 RepID=UPI0026DAED13
DQSTAATSGDWSTAATSGYHSVALAAGKQSKAKASAGSAIVCVYRDNDGKLIHIRAGIAGIDVKADTWYTLDAEGNFVEV